MQKNEITRAVLHELDQELTRARILLLERELAQTRGKMQRLQQRKKQSQTPAAPSLKKLQSELEEMQSELQTLANSLNPYAAGAPKTDRANGCN
jgi:predicted translin family RNA/ssDNA-binding protein